MTTLVGREFWHISSILRHGVVTEQKFSPDYCLAASAFGDLALPSTSLILNKQEVINQCREEAAYWSKKAEELEREL
jgi:hypothetical protein